MIKVGIVGGTGYTGVELLRILSAHPGVELAVITSRSDKGTAVSDMFPSLRGIVDLTFTSPEESALNTCDVVFFCDATRYRHVTRQRIAGSPRQNH